VLRLVGVTVLALLAAGAWASWNAPALRARYEAHRLSTATTDEERAAWANALAACGEPGVQKLVGCVRSGDEPTRAAAAAALDRYLLALPDGDPRAVTLAGALLDAFHATDEPGKRAILGLLPAILKRTGNTHGARCREVVAAGLAMPDPDARLTAVRLAMHPDVRLRADVRPLLSAAEPRVRGAALFAVATPADGEPLVGDEELFRWLHDPDAGVRQVCHAALVGRDRSEVEIGLGRRLTHPEATERLKLLLDLRYDDLADPEPWLERLSRDPEPAVRAGAARVAVEVSVARQLPCPAWVARVADADPHPTVRLVAAYYRAQPMPADGVRPAGAP
jgi:hypothetical protein